MKENYRTTFGANGHAYGEDCDDAGNHPYVPHQNYSKDFDHSGYNPSIFDK